MRINKESESAEIAVRKKTLLVLGATFVIPTIIVLIAFTFIYNCVSIISQKCYEIHSFTL